MQQFDAQRHRGTEGFGIFDGKEKHMVHAAKENKILKWLVKYDSPLLLMHHRFPTSTVNVKRAAHPFSTKGYFGDTQYILVHNGSIRNAEELYAEHYDKDIKYHSVLQDATFNDSEALLWDFALTMEGKQKELTAYGAIAFICLKLEKGKLTKMYFGRNTNPLHLKRDKTGISLSSEGEGELVEANTLYTWNYKLRRLTRKPMKIPSFNPNYTPAPYSTAPYSGAPYSWNSDGWYDNRPFGNSLITQEIADKYGLRRGVDYMLGAGYDDDIMEYEETKSGIFVPVSTAEIEAELKAADYDIPTDSQVEMNAMAYLARCKGRFEDAYWMLEAEFSELEEQYETLEVLAEKLLIEKTVDYISYDPEYENEDSISSIWEILWQQQNLTS